MARFKLTKAAGDATGNVASKEAKAVAMATEEATKAALKNGRKLGKVTVGAQRIIKKESKQRLEAGELFNRAKKCNKGSSKAKSLAEHYADSVNSNRPWKWRDIPGGEELTTGQKAAIKREAIESGLISDVPMKPGSKYPDFEKAGLIQKVDELPKELWQASDKSQFKYLDSRISGGRPDGTTWHHSEVPGRMELIPFGPHNVINHMGGRSSGGWCYRPEGR